MSPTHPVTRGLKLAPHFYHRPQDIIHIPAWLLFGYYFAVMKIYTLFTLHEVCLISLSLASAVLTQDRMLHIGGMGHPRAGCY